MRRLYSMFADGWPGVGLLMMRLVVGAVVLWHVGHLGSDPPLHLIVSALLGLGGLFLIAGFWTPIAGAIVALVALFEIVATGDAPITRLLAATIAGALAMLGPGRLSIDAWLFGWKRIEAPVSRHNSSDG